MLFAAAKVNDYCLNDRQCVLGNKFTFCKYIIPRIYGKCKCPSGYVIKDDERCLPSTVSFKVYVTNQANLVTKFQIH